MLLHFLKGRSAGGNIRLYFSFRYSLLVRDSSHETSISISSDYVSIHLMTSIYVGQRQIEAGVGAKKNRCHLLALPYFEDVMVW